MGSPLTGPPGMKQGRPDSMGPKPRAAVDRRPDRRSADLQIFGRFLATVRDDVEPLRGLPAKRISLILNDRGITTPRVGKWPRK
jgi:hypothetical protein